jgi:hypothetical protein
MSITTDPNDLEFRKALRELGAPDWYPQNAPIHMLNGESGSLANGGRFAKFVCPVCGWERHFINSEMEVINRGDLWALHRGSTNQDLQITGLEIRQDESVPEEFENFLDGLE